MTPIAQVASPPAKPTMIYDGDCKFCALWIRRWEHTTCGRVDFLPYQDPQVAARFPEIPREQFERSVQLIDPDGSVTGSAQAVFRAMALGSQGPWLWDLYRHWWIFARLSEIAYFFVAGHRKTFSFFTGVLWGRHVEPPTHLLVRWTFLRCLAIVYFIAFGSLWLQVNGLIGSGGIVPAAITMDAAKHEVALAGIGLNRFHLLPTLCWFSASDHFLQFQCGAGVVFSLLLAIGFAPLLSLLALWVLYLSLTTIGGVFMGFQWDNLLLEAGLLAIFFAPSQFLPRRPAAETPPSRLVLWLLRWLVFRLMFESGCVKWLSGDPAWRKMTALTFHYETQPLPTWIGWYAHQLPLWVQKTDTFAMFAIEVAVPFLLFFPRRPRQFACLAFIALQIFILLTGNYGFFNLLAIVLCIPLLDDAALQKCWPRRTSASNADAQFIHPPRAAKWPGLFGVGLAAMVLCTSLVQFMTLFRAPVRGPYQVLALYNWIQPFRSFNSYGLFAVMTTSRPEIIIEGSNDGMEWKAYEFKYKPGNTKLPPRFVAPYQPRLDWQLWFAALSDYQRNPWFVNFCIRLLQASPQALSLLKHDPFGGLPPRYIRASLYQYHFTDSATRRRTGDWWRREFLGTYLPPISREREALTRPGLNSLLQLKPCQAFLNADFKKIEPVLAGCGVLPRPGFAGDLRFIGG